MASTATVGGQQVEAAEAPQADTPPPRRSSFGDITRQPGGADWAAGETGRHAQGDWKVKSWKGAGQGQLGRREKKRR